jgi:DNA-binding transcriptional regulator of glucitol operon
LGYALQWPAFAGFCIYAYRKFMQYEAHPPEPAATEAPTELPAGLLPARPAASAQPQDATMREYNAYLAELAKSDRAGGADQKGTPA